MIKTNKRRVAVKLTVQPTNYIINQRLTSELIKQIGDTRKATTAKGKFKEKKK